MGKTFLNFHPVGRTFKTVRYLIQAAGAAKNTRSGLSVKDVSIKGSALSTSLIKSTAKFVDNLFNEGDGWSGERREMMDEKLALVETGYGALTSNPYSESDTFVPAQNFFDVIHTGSKLDQLDEGSQSVVIVSNFGVLDEQSQSVAMDKLAKGSLFSRRTGFDVEEFGLFDSSTAVIQECTYTRTGEQSSELDNCEMVWQGFNEEIYLRMVTLKSEISTDAQRNELITAVRTVCKFKVTTEANTMCTTEEASRVQIQKSVDIQCPGSSSSNCVQTDIKIQATNDELKRELYSRLTEDALKGYKQVKGTFNCNPGGRRVNTDIPNLLSFEVCSVDCGKCPEGQFGAIVDVGTKSPSDCTECPRGTYWKHDTVGGDQAASCNLCPAGKYSATLGATSVTTCFICPKYSTSAVGSSSICDCSEKNRTTATPLIVFHKCTSETVLLSVSGAAPLAVTTDGTNPQCSQKSADPS